MQPKQWLLDPNCCQNISLAILWHLDWAMAVWYKKYALGCTQNFEFLELWVCQWLPNSQEQKFYTAHYIRTHGQTF
jgi:hypothetical protein